MSWRSILYLAAVLLTITAAAVYMLSGVISLSDPIRWPLNVLWLLDGAGYLILMGFAMVRVYRSYLRLIPRDTAQVLLMIYAALNIVVWSLLIGGPPTMPELVTRGIEALLILAMFLYRRSLRRT